LFIVTGVPVTINNEKFKLKTLIPVRDEDQVDESPAVPPCFLGILRPGSLQIRPGLTVYICATLTAGVSGAPTQLGFYFHKMSASFCENNGSNLQVAAPEGFSALLTVPAYTLPGSLAVDERAYSFPSSLL
jgi:hypothetical protein